MASVASQLIQEVTAHAPSDSLEERYAQTELTFRITYVCVPQRTGNLWILGVKKFVNDNGKLQMFAQLVLQ